MANINCNSIRSKHAVDANFEYQLRKIELNIDKWYTRCMHTCCSQNTKIGQSIKDKQNNHRAAGTGSAHQDKRCIAYCK